MLYVFNYRLQIAIVLALVALFTACQRDLAEDVLLFDFESDAELNLLDWHCHAIFSLSSDHATHGKRSLKMELFPSSYPRLDAILRIQDWRNYRELSFDVYNPLHRRVPLTVRIDDRENPALNGDWYSKSFLLMEGANHISIPLDSLVASGAKRSLSLDHILSLVIFLDHPDRKTTLYIDTIKLVRNMK